MEVIGKKAMSWRRTALWYCTASYSQALIPSPPLCVRQIRVSISVRLCAFWLNPKWQPLQGPNGGEKSECRKFSTALSEPKVTQMCPSLPLLCVFLSPCDGCVIPGFLLTVCPFYPSISFIPSHFFLNCQHQPLLKTLRAVLSISVACFFRNNNNVLQLPDLIRDLH